MAQHAQLRIETGLEIYFCDPRSQWQRGTNENTNGLLRQYFPKGTDMSRYDERELDAVAATAKWQAAQDAGLENTGRGTEQSNICNLTAWCCNDSLNPSCVPRSECTTRPAAGLRCTIVICKAVQTSVAGLALAIAQPTILRECKSSTAAKYSQPLFVRM